MRHVLFAVALVSFLASAAGPRPESIPASLWEWAPWVLRHEKDALCPFLQGSETKACAWPGRLVLTLDDWGGRFTQSFKVFGRDAWLPLPGDPKRWPQHVQVDGRPAVVVSDEAQNPTVLLSAGEHSVTGDFEWDALPEALEIPPETGLLTLGVKTWLEHRQSLEMERSQEVEEPSTGSRQPSAVSRQH